MIDNPYEFSEAQKLLKQMEVEQMNHMSNDQIKKRVRNTSATHDGSLSLSSDSSPYNAVDRYEVQRRTLRGSVESSGRYRMLRHARRSAPGRRINMKS